MTGTVRDAALDEPLPGVVIEVEGLASTVTDAEGTFALTLPPGRWLVRASLVGYARTSVEVEVVGGGRHPVDFRLAAGTAPYTERITVRPQAPGSDRSPPSTFTLTPGELLALRGVLADDPFRAVQAVPGVAAGDDFRAEFAVRGHGPRHLGISLDGMDTRLLVHSVRGVGDTGSLAIFNTDVLSTVALASGARRQPDSGRLGARLTFDLRDGSRERFSARGSVSGTAATVVAEGPLGSARSASFLLSLRRSYLDWLLRRIDPEADETFGFTDTLARVSWQIAPRHAARLTFVGARSALRGTDASDPGPNSLETGRSTTRLTNLEWQFAPGERLVAIQRLWNADATYRNETFAGGVREGGRDREWVYRLDLLAAPADRVDVEAGVRLGWIEAEREARSFSGGRERLTLQRAADDSSRAAYASIEIRPTQRVAVVAGNRLEWARMTATTTSSPWVLGELKVGASTSVHFGAARHHQHPTPADGPAEGVRLAPERSWLADVGIARRRERWTASVTGYYRREHDGLREGGEFFLRDGIVRRREAGLRNSYRGRASGFELLLRRQSAQGLTGWVTYAYGHYRLHDDSTGERFAADFDQRHAFSTFVAYRHSSRSTFSVRWQAGSNVPLSGYLDRRGESYVLGEQRNATRLPAYSRLDVRADRTFDIGRRRLTLFVEVLNLLNRRNVGPGNPGVDTRTGLVRNAEEKLFPILPSAGLLLEW